MNEEKIKYVASHTRDAKPLAHHEINSDFDWTKTLPKTLRELYRGLRQEGFDEIQSLDMTKTYMLNVLGICGMTGE